MTNENYSYYHVSPTPFTAPGVDFTWEREWRLKTDGYHFHPGNTQIIVPDNSWAQRLIAEHDKEQQWQTLQYSKIMDELLAIQYEEPFQWVIVDLNNT